MVTESSNKYQEVYEVANNLYQQNPDWVTFFREVLGIEGVMRKAFPDQAGLTAFEQSQQFAEIQHMLAKLREQNGLPTSGDEPTRVITVRLPKSLHESLRTEAYERQTSMNKLCISKLLQIIDGELVPIDS